MCGRDNPSHLIFCQECGQRLAPRIAATASPEAAPLPTSPLAATAATPVVAQGPPPGPAKGPRPPAPEVSFIKRGPAEQPAAPSLPLEQSGAGAQPTVTCMLCGSANQRELRFCMTCGQLLT